MGNTGNPDAIPALARALEHEAEPLVRGHAAWALGRIGGRRSQAALERCRRRETDGSVAVELDAALVALASGLTGASAS
jgi:epoxyqueuosine reductase